MKKLTTKEVKLLLSRCQTVAGKVEFLMQLLNNKLITKKQMIALLK